jgi:hypothetical protein
MIALALSALIDAQGYGQIRPYPAPDTIFSGPTWESRQKALGAALQHYPLSDPAMQKATAQLLYREENDPNWAENDEGQDFEHYEEALWDLNKRIALTYGNPMAWHALVWSNYDPDSTFAEWLRKQPQAVRLILKMADDPREVPQGGAAEMLSKLIGDCGTGPQIATCRLIEPQRERILSTIRQRILGSPDQKKGLLIEALGYGGSATDIEFLQRLSDRQRARKIAPGQNIEFSLQKAIIFLCQRAQDNIRQRLASADSR